MGLNMGGSVCVNGGGCANVGDRCVNGVVNTWGVGVHR